MTYTPSFSTLGCDPLIEFAVFRSKIAKWARGLLCLPLLALPLAAQNVSRLTLQQSTGLQDWQAVTITPAMLDANGKILVPTDTAARFYRMQVETVSSSVPEGFALIPAGSFTMGASLAEMSGMAPPDDSLDEIPTHTVALDTFIMQKTEVTKTQWDEVRNWAATRGYIDLPVGNGVSNQPVNEVNWYDVIKWCNARSEKEGLAPVYFVSAAVFRTGSSVPTVNWSANGYRLPTEAEWEKASRGGLIGKRYPWGDTISPSQANYRISDAVSGSLLDVATYAANGYGLHDMAGNVWEWCWDRYQADYYASSPGSNPLGAAAGEFRCMRGGCWYDEFPTRLRCANRGFDDPAAVFNDVGFRPARRW